MAIILPTEKRRIRTVSVERRKYTIILDRFLITVFCIFQYNMELMKGYLACISLIGTIGSLTSTGE